MEANDLCDVAKMNLMGSWQDLYCGLFVNAVNGGIHGFKQAIFNCVPDYNCMESNDPLVCGHFRPYVRSLQYL